MKDIQAVELSLRGHSVNVRHLHEGGAGTPVVCVHSSGMSGRQWRRLAKTLARRDHPVWLPDLHGYGDSTPWLGRERFETSMDVEIITRLLDRIGRPVHLVGHSYGGRIAILSAIARPGDVKSLGLYEPVSYGVLHSTGDEIGMRELDEYDADGRFLDETFGGTEVWLERFVDYWSGEGMWASMPDEARVGFTRSARKVFEEVKDTCLDTITHQEVRETEIPTLTMSGGRSRLSARRVCEVLAISCDNVRHECLEDGIHMSPLISPAEVNEHLIAHIERADSTI